MPIIRNFDRVTALYERLPKDDEQQGESNSILNQKRFLEDFARKSGMKNIKYFTDDGYTGRNFNRPGFQAMLAEARRKAEQEAAEKAKRKKNRQRESNAAHRAKTKVERWVANNSHKYPKRICEQCGKECYPNSTRRRFCNTDCTKVHQQVEALFSRLVKQLSEKEGVTEALKVENQMLWVQKMNNIRNAARYCFKRFDLRITNNRKSCCQATVAFLFLEVFKKL